MLNQEKYRNRNKKRQEYQNQRGETPISSQSARSHEHLTIETKRPIFGRANPGSSESDLVSVCVKRTARAYKQCAQNNNKINYKHKITK